MNQALTGDAAVVLASHVATGTVPEASRRAAARLVLDTIGAAIAAHDAAGLPGIRRRDRGLGRQARRDRDRDRRPGAGP